MGAVSRSACLKDIVWEVVLAVSHSVFLKCIVCYAALAVSHSACLKDIVWEVVFAVSHSAC